MPSVNFPPYRLWQRVGVSTRCGQKIPSYFGQNLGTELVQADQHIDIPNHDQQILAYLRVRITHNKMKCLKEPPMMVKKYENHA